MQFLVVYRPPQRFADGGVPDDFAEVEGREQVRLQELYAAGSAREAWALDVPDRGAAVLYEVGSADDLEGINRSFPMVQRGYSEYRVYPLAPYPGFGPRAG